MKCNTLRSLITGVLLLSTAAASLSGQQSQGAPEQELPPVQQALLSYARLKAFNADPQQLSALENRMFKAPDSLAHKDALVWTATRYLEKSMPDKAIPLLLEAIGEDKRPDWTTTCTIYLCEAYREKQEYLKAFEMLGEVLHRKENISDENKAFACNRLAAIYNEWGQPAASYGDSVVKYSEQCIAISEKINSISNMAFSQNELSFQFYRKRDFTKALDLSMKAVANFKQAGMQFSAMNALITQSNIFSGMDEQEAALRAVIDATNLCSIEENRNLYMRLYLRSASVYKAMGNYRAAFEFLELSRLLQLDFFRDRIDTQINEQSARYNLLIKEQKIKEQEQNNAFHKKQILFLILTLIVLTISFFISIFYLKSRRTAFIKQKLIEAVVETEASERKRIASDLHDGLGPVLSAINLYFHAYVDSGAAEKPSIENRIREVISGAIDDVTRISHNISPHVLEIHGLNTALKNFISPVLNSGRLLVEFHSEIKDRFDLNKELAIYRCITELLNNTIRHAEATRVTIAIHTREKGLQISYTDNGKGFDPALENPDGMGLYNIKNRVETYGGQLNIENMSHKGIRVSIDIPL